MVQRIGGRKFSLGLIWFGCSTAIAWKALATSADLFGSAALIASMATGFGVVVWGYVGEYRAKNGR